MLHENTYEFDGIKVLTDKLNRLRSDDNDNVMEIFYEEQPASWLFVMDALKKGFSGSAPKFLDIGCGCGIFGLLAAKHLKAEVTAIDISSRAIEFTRENAKLNGLELNLKHEAYSKESFAANAADIICMNPPFHIYPREFETSLPQHARGGSDGQTEFKSQLTIAFSHLSANGYLFFVIMCGGDDQQPDFCNYIPSIFKNRSLVYTNILPPISSRDFMFQLYGEKYQYFTRNYEASFPWIYYCTGLVKATSDSSEITCKQHSIDLKGRGWSDRIELHQAINEHVIN